jgi:hypothetical protein
MMEAVRTSETSVDNHFTRQYIPENNSEHHTRRRENLKSHKFYNARYLSSASWTNSYLHTVAHTYTSATYLACSLRKERLIHNTTGCRTKMGTGFEQQNYYLHDICKFAAGASQRNATENDQQRLHGWNLISDDTQQETKLINHW